MMRLHEKRVIQFGIAALAACTRTGHENPERTLPAASAQLADAAMPSFAPTALLPNIATFAGSPVVSEGQFVRRTYARGSASVTVTIGRFALDARGYEEWVKQSESYPQAKLDLAPWSGNGFYECAADDARACNLLIQLRAGRHIEIRGGGTATRGDVDDIAASLPLRAMAQ